MPMSRNQRSPREKDGNRGQIDPRHIAGGVILLIILPALVTVWVDLKNGFASAPGFSEIGAMFIALLLVLAIAFMILGIE